MQTNGNVQMTNGDDIRQISNPIPKLSAYIRRKSESYISRRRSDEYRNQSQSNEKQSSAKTTAQVHPKDIKEEDAQLRENNSQHDLLKNGELL